MSEHDDLEAMAAALEASGRYRVLRKLLPDSARSTPPVNSALRNGLFVDFETTGLDADRDEVIEIALVPFVYGVDGTIHDVLLAYQSFAEPSAPLSAEITRITGITDAMVTGQRIDLNVVETMTAAADLVIAHNAAFDRRFAERLTTVFETKPWACSMSQIDWAGEGYEGTKLAYLATSAGFFYDRHRAENDCLAAIELLRRPLLTSGASAMAQLLDRARRPSWRIWAENSPFDLKDVLKARGYRWNADAAAAPRAWYIDVEDDAREDELGFLREEIYQREIDPTVHAITAYNRFSARVAQRS